MDKLSSKTHTHQGRTLLHGLEGKVVVIIGASVGIGAAAARVFSELGARLVLGSRDEATIEQLAIELNAAGGSVLAVPVDVALGGAVESAVSVALEHFGQLDIAFNNAGVQGPAKPLAQQSEQEFDRILDINLKGVWRAMKAELPHMLERGGAIVNTASVGGLVAAPGISPYCASKHGVIGLSKSAALDYAPGVRINVVAPGAINTAMFNDWMTDPEQRQRMVDLHPLGRVGEPREVAETVAWLCSSAAGYITGAVVPVDGGYTIA